MFMLLCYIRTNGYIMFCFSIIVYFNENIALDLRRQKRKYSDSLPFYQLKR